MLPYSELKQVSELRVGVSVQWEAERSRTGMDG